MSFVTLTSDQAEGLLDPDRPLIPEGEYIVKYNYHETAIMFGKSRKLTLWMQLCDPACPHFGLILPKYYNVTELKGKPGRGGKFKAAHGSSLAMDYCELFMTTGRLDRISFDPFRSNALVAVVRTVRCNQTQRALPEPLQYSVIDRFKEVFKP
jgi:hypothetical protein